MSSFTANITKAAMAGYKNNSSQPGGQNAPLDPTPSNFQMILDTYKAGRVTDAENFSKQAGFAGLIPILMDYQSLYGRLPTVQEVAQANPVYMQSRESGGAYLANLKSMQDNTPEAIANKQNQAALDKYKAGADAYNGQVNDVFQSAVGRDATPAEQSHFGALLASGQIDPYGLTQLVGGTQEAQQRQTSQYQDTLSKNLQGTQADYYKNQILPSLQSTYAKQGRSFDSSAFANAAVGAGQQQNYQLQNYLAQFGAGQYGQSSANQRDQYNQYLQSVYGMQNANLNSVLNTNAYATGQADQYSQYGLQKAAYDQYLARYGKRSPAMGAIQGGVAGAGAGATFGPWGAVIGGVGGALLGAYGSQNY